MTPRALRKRGFNQAAFVAHLIGRHLGIPVSASVLKKTRESERQSALGAKERRINLKGAFRCTQGLQGKHVVLVDDILTTGATATEAFDGIEAADEAIAVDLAPTLAQVTGKALTAVKKWATKSKGASSAAKNPPKALPRTAAALERTGNDAAKG